MSPKVAHRLLRGSTTAPSKLLNFLETPSLPHGAFLPRTQYQGEHSFCVEISTRRRRMHLQSW